MKGGLIQLVLPGRAVMLGALLICHTASAAEFSNVLARAAESEKKSDLEAAVKLLSTAESLASSNSPELCVLSRSFCDLMYLTSSAPEKKELLLRAQRCAERAIQLNADNATAHASLAVCLAQGCSFANIKEQLALSRQFKDEAEKALALDPRQDIAYYLLGRWNYAIANLGPLSRVYVKVIYGGLPEASNAEAIKNFQKAIELAPQRIIHHAGLATAYAAAGEKSAERMELEKCRALPPVDREDFDARREAEKRLAALRPKSR
jgi:tetratricopeptide (TPR) repeat protein